MNPYAPTEQPACDGLVLSGGRGLRVGRKDKGLMSTAATMRMSNDSTRDINQHRQRAAEKAVGLLRPLCRRIYISANRNLPSYRSIPDVAVITDRDDSFAGPLAAFDAAVELPLAPLLLVLPNDLPLLDAAVPQTLLQTLSAAGRSVGAVYARDGVREHYLCACIRSEHLAGARAALARGEHRVGVWLKELKSLPVDFSSAHAQGLRNFNTLSDWQELDQHNA